MRLLSKLLIIFAFAVILTFTASSAFATTNNNNNNNWSNFFANWMNIVFNNHNNNDNHNNNNFNQFFCKFHLWDKSCKQNNDNDNNDCRKHPERNQCHVSVPEFGLIPGAIALLSSGGTFLFLKKRYN